jgi:hypothetical protein
MIENIKPKSISNSKILLFDFHIRLDRFSSLYCFLYNFVYFIEIYSCLSNQIVKADKILIPNLNSEYIWIHVLWFRRIIDREFKSVVEITNCSTSPVSISLLWLWSPNYASNKNIIWLHLYIFVNTVISFPNNNS